MKMFLLRKDSIFGGDGDCQACHFEVKGIFSTKELAQAEIKAEVKRLGIADGYNLYDISEIEVDKPFYG